MPSISPASILRSSERSGDRAKDARRSLGGGGLYWIVNPLRPDELRLACHKNSSSLVEAQRRQSEGCAQCTRNEHVMPFDVGTQARVTAAGEAGRVWRRVGSPGRA